MIVSEKQLLIMFRVLEGSLIMHDRTDMNIFGYDNMTRRDVYNQIINQQSDELINIKNVKTDESIGIITGDKTENPG
jgi:hypothetical protein